MKKENLKQIAYVKWEWADSWSGPELIGCSLHLTQKNAEKYIEGMYKGREISDSVPDEYLRTAMNMPQTARVNNSLYEKIKGKKDGLRLTEPDEENAVKSKQLYYNPQKPQKIPSLRELIEETIEETKKYLKKSVRNGAKNDRK